MLNLRFGRRRALPETLVKQQLLDSLNSLLSLIFYYNYDVIKAVYHGSEDYIYVRKYSGLPITNREIL